MESLAISGWERTVRAVEKVRDRLRRVTAALDGAGIPYAVIGGNAVTEWVGRADEAAVRNTPNVEILLRRTDLPASITAVEPAGFVYRHAASIDVFLDGADGKARDAVHVIFANEKVRPEYADPAPDVSESEQGSSFRVLSFESLVRMKLTSNRRKDQVHLLDMISVGLLDESWPARFSPELAGRLQHLLETPEG